VAQSVLAMPATKLALCFGLAAARVSGPTVRPCFEDIQANGWRKLEGGHENGAHIFVEELVGKPDGGQELVDARGDDVLQRVGQMVLLELRGDVPLQGE